MGSSLSNLLDARSLVERQHHRPRHGIGHAEAAVQQIAADNLAAWKDSGVVMTLKWHSAEDPDVCATCRARHGTVPKIADAEIGVNLPPHSACSSARCRCHFRPWVFSIG